MECWTRYPVKTRSRPSSRAMGMWDDDFARRDCADFLHPFIQAEPAGGFVERTSAEIFGLNSVSRGRRHGRFEDNNLGCLHCYYRDMFTGDADARSLSVQAVSSPTSSYAARSCLDRIAEFPGTDRPRQCRRPTLAGRDRWGFRWRRIVTRRPTSLWTSRSPDRCEDERHFGGVEGSPGPGWDG